VASHFIAANQHPDHDILAHFRKTLPMELEQTMKVVKLEQISLATRSRPIPH